MVVSTLSAATGVGEPTLRLLLSMLFAYPIALVYHIFFLRPIHLKSAPFIRNLYIVVAGLALSYFYNGYDIIHSLITVTVTWSLMWFGNFVGNRTLGAQLTFVFNMAYLLCGYLFISTDDYDISWTMTQCVLCLRMIGFGMDYMDGASLLKSSPPSEKQSPPPSERSEEQSPSSPVTSQSPLSPRTPKTDLFVKKPPKPPTSFAKDSKLATLPPFLEAIGYAHFFGAFLIGPQFSFSLYKKFITFSIFPDSTRIPPGSYKSALKCFLIGAAYLGVNQIGAGFFPMSYLTTAEYAAKPLLQKLLIIWASGKFAFSKYLGVWTLVEGSCVLSGISFNDYDDDSGHAKWNGLANVEKLKFEFATSLTQIVASFNTNTNLWTKIYIFKRLIFLNNKTISSISALFFLAIWHGIHVGYFLCFFLEFVDIEAEKRWSKRLEPYTKPLYENTHKSGVQVLRRLHEFATWVGQTCALHYAMVPFELLKWPSIKAAWGNVYYVGHVIIIGLLVLDAVLPRKKAKKVEPVANEKANPINLDEKVGARLNGETKIKW